MSSGYLIESEKGEDVLPVPSSVLDFLSEDERIRKFLEDYGDILGPLLAPFVSRLHRMTNYSEKDAKVLELEIKLHLRAFLFSLPDWERDPQVIHFLHAIEALIKANICAGKGGWFLKTLVTRIEKTVSEEEGRKKWSFF